MLDKNLEKETSLQFPIHSSLPLNSPSLIPSSSVQPSHQVPNPYPAADSHDSLEIPLLSLPLPLPTSSKLSNLLKDLQSWTSLHVYGVLSSLKVNSSFPLSSNFQSPPPSTSSSFSSCRPVCLLGNFYSSTSSPEFLSDWESKVWITYRSGFSQKIDSTSYSNDVGWGCMIRTGQMLLASALRVHWLGSSECTVPLPIFLSILKLISSHPPIP